MRELASATSDSDYFTPVLDYSPLDAVEDELSIFLLGVLVPGPVTQVVGRELGEEQADVVAGRGQGRVPGGRQHHLYQGVSAADCVTSE